MHVVPLALKFVGFCDGPSLLFAGGDTECKLHGCQTGWTLQRFIQRDTG